MTLVAEAATDGRTHKLHTLHRFANHW